MTISIKSPNKKAFYLTSSIKTLQFLAYSFCATGTVVSIIALVSSNKLLDKTIPLFWIGAFATTSVQAKKHKEKAEKNLENFRSELALSKGNLISLQSRVTENRSELELLQGQKSTIKNLEQQILEIADSQASFESEFAQNQENLIHLSSQTSAVINAQEQISARFDVVSGRADQQVRLVETKIETCENQFEQNHSILTNLQSRVTENSSELELLQGQKSTIKNLEQQILEIADSQASFESEFAQNQENLIHLSSQTSAVINAQEQISARFDVVSGRVDQQVRLIKTKIETCEAQFEQYASKHYIAAIKNRLSRLQRQYRQARLTTPGYIVQLDQVQQQVEELNTTVETIQKHQIPTAEKPYNLPPKRRLRNRGDRVGVFVDGENLRISANEIWGCHLAWDEFLGMIQGQSQICEARYYTSYNRRRKDFFSVLEGFGYRVIYRSTKERSNAPGGTNIDVELCSDMLASVNRYDTFVLASGDGDFLDTLKRLRSMGKRVEVVSFSARTHNRLSNSADSYLDLTQYKDEIASSC